MKQEENCFEAFNPKCEKKIRFTASMNPTLKVMSSMPRTGNVILREEQFCFNVVKKFKVKSKDIGFINLYNDLRCLFHNGKMWPASYVTIH